MDRKAASAFILLFHAHHVAVLFGVPRNSLTLVARQVEFHTDVLVVRRALEVQAAL